jgi:hypothetical protein
MWGRTHVRTRCFHYDRCGEVSRESTNAVPAPKFAWISSPCPELKQCNHRLDGEGRLVGRSWGAHATVHGVFTTTGTGRSDTSHQMPSPSPNLCGSPRPGLLCPDAGGTRPSLASQSCIGVSWVIAVRFSQFLIAVSFYSTSELVTRTYVNCCCVKGWNCLENECYRNSQPIPLRLHWLALF